MAKLVLIVDDDDMVRATTVDLVESLGYRTASVANADDALQLVTGDRFDAVLTDVRMPGMNGFQLAKCIRAIKPELPIICVTGHADVTDDLRYCDLLIKKPYHIAFIANVLIALIGA